MGGLGKFLIGALMIYLPINFVLYLFSNDAIGVVKSASLKEIVEADTRADDAEGAVFSTSFGLDQSADSYAEGTVKELASYGDDVDSPLYRLLKMNTTNISDVTVRAVDLSNPNLSCEFSNSYGQKFVDLSYIDKSKEGSAKVDLIFGAVGKSFLRPLSGHINCIVVEYVTLLDENNRPKSNPVPAGMGPSGMMNFGPIGRSTRPH